MFSLVLRAERLTVGLLGGDDAVYDEDAVDGRAVCAGPGTVRPDDDDAIEGRVSTESEREHRLARG